MNISASSSSSRHPDRCRSASRHVKPVGVLGCSALLASFASGCMYSDNVAALSGPAALAPEPAQVWSRPAELGVDVALDETIQGGSRSVKLFGFTIDGDDADISVFAFGPLGLLYHEGDSGGSALDRIAAARAVEQSAAPADGIYVLHTERHGINLMIYSNQRVTVTGRPVRLQDLGPVSVERADAARNSTSLPIHLDFASWLDQISREQAKPDVAPKPVPAKAKVTKTAPRKPPASPAPPVP